MNYSTSTAFDDNAWVVPGPFPVSVGNTYLIGVRARDSYGDVSAVATTTWNFPAGFVSYRLSPSLNYASQYFTVSTTSTLQSIEIFTTNMQTNARNPDSAGCSLAMFYSDTPVSYRTVPADNGYGGYGCGGYLPIHLLRRIYSSPPVRNINGYSNRAPGILPRAQASSFMARL